MPEVSYSEREKVYLRSLDVVGGEGEFEDYPFDTADDPFYRRLNKHQNEPTEIVYFGDDFAYFQEVIYKFAIDLENYDLADGSPRWDFLITENNKLIQELDKGDMERLSIQPPSHSEGLFGKSVAQKGSPRECYRSALFYGLKANQNDIEPFEVESKYRP